MARRSERKIASKTAEWARSRRLRLPHWVRETPFKVAITTGLIVALFPAFVFPWLQSLDDPDSIADQLREIRTDAAEDNLSTVVARRIDLQRSGRLDYLLVFRNRKLRQLSGSGPAAVSDDIRVYTENGGGELGLVFNFQPTPLRPIYSLNFLLNALRHPDLYKTGPGVPLTFQVATIRDLDGNDRPEILGAYFQRHMTDVNPIPVVLTWSDFHGDYELYPLLTRPPKLRHLKAGLFGASMRRQYRLPIELRDEDSGVAKDAYAVQGFGVTATASGQPGLVTSFLGRSPSHAEPQSVELKLAVVSYEDAPITQECGFGKLPERSGDVPNYGVSKLLSLPPEVFTQMGFTGYFEDVPLGFADEFLC